MKDIYKILSELGVTVPEDKKDEFTKEFNENYKTVNELNQVKSKLDTANQTIATQKESLTKRDADLADLKTQLEKAGNDAQQLSKLQEDLSTLQTKYNDDTKALNDKLAEQQYDSIVKESIKDFKFSSEGAKKAFILELKNKALKVDNEKLVGFNEFVNDYKTNDPQTFVVEQKEQQPNPPTFTTPNGNNLQQPKSTFGFNFVGVRSHEPSK